MTRHTVMPLLMGAGMGLMMLWMVHMQLTGDGSRSLGALIVFAGAHVVVLGIALMLPLVASVRLRRALDRIHRPSWRHAGMMLAGAICAAGLTHIFLHGGLI